MKCLSILLIVPVLLISCQNNGNIQNSTKKPFSFVKSSPSKDPVHPNKIKKLRKRALVMLLKTRESHGKLSYFEVSQTMKEARIPVNQMVPTLLTGLKSDDAIIRENSQKALF